MVRSVLAILAGVVVGFILVGLGELPSFFLFPPPAGMDFNDSAVLNAYAQTLPPAAFLTLLVVHAIAAFGAGLVAAWIASRAKAVHALVVGFLLLAGAGLNLASFWHPLWFWVAEILLYLPAAYAGALLAPRPRRASVGVSGL